MNSDTTNSGKKNKVSGSIELGGEYGLNPLIIAGDQPSTNVFSQGAIGFNVLKTPINIRYRINSNSGIYGLNNYLRFEYDAEKHKQQIRDAKERKTGILQNRRDSLHVLKQSSEKRLQYLSIANAKILLRNLKGNLIKRSLPDSLREDYKEYEDTSIVLSPGEFQQDFGLDSLEYNELPADSLNLDNPSIEWSQFLSGMIQRRKENALQRKKEINEDIERTEKQLDSVQSKGDSYGKESLPLNGRLKSMKIGLHFLNHSWFLARGVALRGSTIELEDSTFYLVLSGGKTVNPLYRTNNVLHNRLNVTRNLYNYFDFGDFTDGRLVTSIYGGIGRPDGNHLHGGILYGSGYSRSLFLDSMGVDQDPVPQRNVVVEVEGQLKLLKNQSMSLAYSRSILWEKPWEKSTGTVTSELLDFSNKTNAIRLAYRGVVFKGAGRISAQSRWIEPEYKSYGTFGVRSDNLRYKLSYSHYLGRKIRLSARIRRDQDNILRRSAYTNVITLVGGQVRLRPLRSLNISASFDPVIHQLSNLDSDNGFRNENYLAVGNIVFMPRVDGIHLVATVSGSHYQLLNGERNDIFQTAEAILNISKDAWTNAFGVHIFNTDTTGMAESQLMFSNNVTIRLKNGFIVEGGVKYLIRNNIGQIGGRVEGIIPILRRYSLRICAERIVYGDYFNVFDFEEWEKFPYLLSTSVRMKF